MAVHCSAQKVNRHAPDFGCDRGEGHSDPHRDPQRGILWRHPSTAYGLKGPKKESGGRKPTKPGCFWSDRPASI